MGKGRTEESILNPFCHSNCLTGFSIEIKYKIGEKVCFSLHLGSNRICKINI